jgi:hypothetical protein
MKEQQLSPAAQAVLNAYEESNNCYREEWGQVAAALRAAAEIVAPLDYEDVWTDGRTLQYEKRDPVREKLLAIATELEKAD